MGSILARARRYESLTPGERALLRLVESLGCVAVVGALTAGGQYLASPLGSGAGGAVDWAMVVRVCAAGGIVALLMALAKYFKAHGDPALADALGTVAARVGVAAPAAGTAAVTLAPAAPSVPVPTVADAALAIPADTQAEAGTAASAEGRMGQ